ncbi:hypothetical protein Q2490_16755 [Myroides odoratimimus]|uniref:hypothetical protein n=1 Tax=Myroides odoratimimus TaxID=76832 RepID=UPI0026DF7B79|nr:hypothetical protein [Myroides odoratimimus]MDO5858928.1 hypothetical protein [Myroides odoratimimus]
MKETFDSVWGSVKDRFTNPFLGTFLFVWIVRNWYLVYGLFIFDKECTMDDKLNYVKDYFKDYDILIEFLKNTGASLLLLVIVYILLIGSQAILQSYHLIINKVNARFDKIPVESKEHYLMLNREFKNLSVKYKELSATNDLNITEIEVLNNTILGHKTDINSLKISNLYIFENFLITFKYLDVNKENKLLLIEYFNNIFKSVKKHFKDEELVTIIANTLKYINNKDKNILIYFEGIYLNKLTSMNNIHHEELTKYNSKLSEIKSRLSKIFSEDITKYEIIAILLNINGVEIVDDITDFGEEVCKELFGY